ncbi:MAG: putative molybdenum carrier protein [Bacteroidales bacterium]
MGKSDDLDRLKLVSGGQTGIDRAVLDFCLEHRIPCGGWCPGDRMAEDGPIDPRYPVRPLPGAGYRERTYANVKDSGATIILHPGKLSGGTAYSAMVARELEKQLLIIDLSVMPTAEAADHILDFLLQHRSSTVNFSGPRESDWKEGYGQCQLLLKRVYGI